MPTEAGKVSVTVGNSHYPPGAVIGATVANGLDRPLSADDSKTACTIAFLQRHENDTWTDIPGCRLGRPASPVVVGPGLGRSLEFDPSSFHLTAAPQGSPLGPGTYRVKFTYRTERGQEPSVAYSTEFTIR